MKRSILITLGIIIILALLAVWLYVLLGGDTSLKEKYANFNFFGENADVSGPEEITEDDFTTEPVVDVTDQSRLKQLTTTPVAGFQEVRLTPTSTPEIYYLEAGTGHIVSINQNSGEEKRVSGTTVPATQKGVITSDGRFAFIQSGFGSDSLFEISEILQGSGLSAQLSLTEKVIDFTTTRDNTFLYTAKVGNSVVGKEYSPLSKKTTVLFTVPFGEARVSWGKTSADSHYIFPKANSWLEGYLYEAKNSSLVRLPAAGYGLTAIGNNNFTLSGYQVKVSYKTKVYDKTSKKVSDFFSTIIPDKCVSLHYANQFICAVPNTPIKSDFPESWYQGVTTYSDDLWEIDPATGSMVFLINIEEESGRKLDIINPNPSTNNDNLYFQNKNDQTLWLYELIEDITFPENATNEEMSS